MKSQNDPWSPMPDKACIIPQPMGDPLRQLIDSDRYIESLERKLKGLKGRRKPEPSSRDIINSLMHFREDQMRRFMEQEEPSQGAGNSVVQPESHQASDNLADRSTTYLQRKIHPERQAINMEELFELLKDDELEKCRCEDDNDSMDDSLFVKEDSNSENSGRDAK